MSNFFSSLFGGSRKQDYSQMIPDPPQFSLAPNSQSDYSGGIQQLIDVFNQQANGQGLFDALQYIYGPQETALNQQYGINTNPGDIYAQRTGALPQTLASLNSRGLLDTGTSGVIEGQLRSNLANQNSQNYGQAKQMQSTQQQNALSALDQLFPQRFQAQNMQGQVDYQNQMNNYNALLQRNAATMGQQAQMDQNKSAANNSLFGIGPGNVQSLFGGFGGSGGSSALMGAGQGAMAGGATGGPYGAIIGGLGGLFSGVMGQTSKPGNSSNAFNLGNPTQSNMLNGNSGFTGGDY